MSKRFTALLVIASFSALAACGKGGAGEDYANAKVHHCNMVKATAELVAKPGDAAVMSRLKESTEMLAAVVGGAKDAAALRVKLAAETCK